MVKHILTPTDGSDLATQAVDKEIALAAGMDAAVTAMTVTEPFHVLSTDAMQVESTRASYETDAAAHAKPVLESARATGQTGGVSIQKTHHKLHDNPWEAIIDAALGEGCDLIAMVSHSWRGMAAMVPGSQTTKTLTHSRIPVLVYR